MELETSILKKYREFDRKKEPTPSFFLIAPTNYDELLNDIKLNGIKEPLEIWVHENKALIVEGNHRLSIAIDLNISSLPVKVKFISGKNREEKEYIERIQKKGKLWI